MKWISALILLAPLLGCHFGKGQPEEPEVAPAMAFVSVAENARAGGMQISQIDGEAVSDTNGFSLTPGPHSMSVACQLDNGIKANFAFQVDLKPNHSYCFFSRDQGQACTIVYTQIAWKGGGVVTCR
jgi:hypothetical protein